MISVEHLTKWYGDFKAVDDLSFEIDEGHVYGFLGPNGAGKSTTMNIITGCLSATSGSVKSQGRRKNRSAICLSSRLYICQKRQWSICGLWQKQKD